MRNKLVFFSGAIYAMIGVVLLIGFSIAFLSESNFLGSTFISEVFGSASAGVSEKSEINNSNLINVKTNLLGVNITSEPVNLSFSNISFINESKKNVNSSIRLNGSSGGGGGGSGGSSGGGSGSSGGSSGGSNGGQIIQNNSLNSTLINATLGDITIINSTYLINLTNITLPANSTNFETPSNLVISRVSDSQIDLKWRDNSLREEGFRLEVFTNELGGWIEAGRVGSNITSFSSKGLKPNTKYFYRVFAFRSGDYLLSGAASNLVSATTLNKIDKGENASENTSLGNEFLRLKVVRIANESWGYNDDRIEFVGVDTGLSYAGTPVYEGKQILTIGAKAKVFEMYYYGSANVAEEQRYLIIEGLNMTLRRGDVFDIPVSIAGAETVPLFTLSNKIYWGQSLNAVRPVITKNNMPNFLSDSKLGDTAVVQSIVIGPAARFGMINSSSGFTFNFTNSVESVYSMQLLFSKVVNLSDEIRKGSTLNIFGKEYRLSSIGGNQYANTPMVVLQSLDGKENLILQDHLEVAKVSYLSTGLSASSYISGTNVTILSNRGYSGIQHVLGIMINVSAKRYAGTFLYEGQKLTDPVFGTFYIDFAKAVDANPKKNSYAEVYLTGIPSSTSVPMQCTDSDANKTALDGINYFLKGTMRNFTANLTDVCANDKEIVEYSCKYGGSIEWFKCPFGCSKGACLFDSKICAIENVSVKEKIISLSEKAKTGSPNVTLIEGGEIRYNGYVVIKSLNKERVLQLVEINSGSSRTDKTSFRDALSGEEFRFYTGVENKSFSFIDGYTFYVALRPYSGSQYLSYVNLTWGEGAVPGHSGMKTDDFSSCLNNVALGIPLRKCQTINKPGYYYLAEDIDNLKILGSCFFVNASNVVFDGRGKLIRHSIHQFTFTMPSTAILINPESKNVIVQNTRIENFWGYTSPSIAGRAIGVQGTNTTLRNNVLVNNGVGIAFRSDSYSTAVNNLLDSNLYGISMLGSFNSNISYNNVIGSIERGIFIAYPETNHNTISNNLFCGSGNYDIWCNTPGINYASANTFNTYAPTGAGCRWMFEGAKKCQVPCAGRLLNITSVGNDKGRISVQYLARGLADKVNVSLVRADIPLGGFSFCSFISGGCSVSSNSNLASCSVTTSCSYPLTFGAYTVVLRDEQCLKTLDARSFIVQ